VKRERRSQYELRCYAGIDLYERVLREAAARRMSVSQCVRLDLSDYYAIRDELIGAVQVAETKSSGDISRRIMHTLLAEMETRIIAGLDRQGSIFEESLSALASMVDAAVFSILCAFPDDRPGVYRPPVSVRDRYDGWRASVLKKLASPEPHWPPPRQIGPRREPSK
jgi:hypothetical protein